jgi:hypothetical protein
VKDHYQNAGHEITSERQVRQNKESQQLQYAVAERVRALGWKQVEIINSDLGSSAGIASAQREGCDPDECTGIMWDGGVQSTMRSARF